MEATRRYISGIHFADGATRKYEYTITEYGEHKGKIIYLEIYTPKNKNGVWGKQKNFWSNGKEEFKTALEAVKSIQKP